MEQKYRIIKTGKECRAKLLSGMNQVCDVVKSTLGPKGKNVVFEAKGKVPRITNDGVSIAREFILKDEIEDLGAQIAIESAIKTNAMAGDGTSSTLVLVQAIANKVFNELNEKTSLIENNVDLMAKKREIETSCLKCIELLKKQAKKITKIEELERVAISSVEDEKLGKIIASMIWTIGVDGFVSVDDTYEFDMDISVVSGMKKY
jgi:chaperonin GroEL